MSTSETPAIERMLTLTGFALAHGVWSISEGETLCTLAVVDEESDQGTQLLRFESTSVAESYDEATKHIEGLGETAKVSVVVFDGKATVYGQRSNALVAEARAVDHQPIRIVLRYRKAQEEKGFGILGDPVFSIQLDSDAMEACLDALYRGVEAHAEASKVWFAHQEAVED